MAVTSQKVERWVIKRETDVTGWPVCTACGSGSTMLSLAEACGLGRLTALEVCSHLAAGTIHGTQTIEGHLLVCSASLLRLRRVITIAGE